MTHRIGVCSWSLQPRDPAELAQRAVAAGVSGVQLALDPLRTGAWSLDRTVQRLQEAGLEIYSGMMAMAGEDYSSLEAIARTGGVRPDSTWAANCVAAADNARLAAELGLDLVSFHAGFLPEQRSDPERARLLDRLRHLCDVFGQAGQRVALETGQETAETLLEVLDELDQEGLGVNFDPANMILYDRGDPVEALAALAPRVLQIHVKDARRTRTPGTWGEEVPVGTGEVDWKAFFDVVRTRSLAVDLLIEREAGDERVADIRSARETVARILGVRG